MQTFQRSFLALLGAALIAWLTPTMAAAQTGTVTGRVIDSQTLEPISSAQVFLPELNIGALTGGDGRFVLVNVPAGSHQVTAQVIGYRSANLDVVVASGESAAADFEMQQDALALDAVVVTGTPGGTQRRAIGNVVGRVDAAAVTEVAPISSMQDLLNGREAGVTFAGGDGVVGSGRSMRIRGVSSLTLSSQPLIYVDGIRVDNNAESGPPIRQGPLTSKLDDINPNDIESIEIIKGPAAATLYGTEASAGVIQIITKKGSTGAPQFDFTVRQGANWLMNSEFKVGDACMRLDEGEAAPQTPSGYMLRDNVFCHNLIADERAAGRDVLQTGHLQNYGVSIRGGTDFARYYVSSDWSDNEGMVDYNYDETLNLRANVTVLPMPALTIDFNTGYVDGFTSYMQQVSNSSIWENLRWGNPATLDDRERGFLRATPEAIAEASGTREYSHFTGSSTITHRPWDFLTQRLVIGRDVSNDVNIRLMPRHPEGEGWFFGAMSLGEKLVNRPKTETTTIDYAASLDYRLNDAIGLTSSVGYQYYRMELEELRAEGRIFPSPTVTSMAGAASTFSSEVHDANASMGVYFQQEMSIRDRIFLTGAVRGDDNSAFGAQYDAAIYPKLSATWVVTDEDFWQWDNLVNSLRLRTAWGKAGRQPSTFAAVTTYAPQVGPAGTPAVRPGLLGNPDVGPEVSTELEVGFDLAMFSDRLTAEVTYYNQDVQDALMEVPVASSIGFGGAQSVNLGQIENWGWEVALNGRILEERNYALDLGVNWSHNDNMVKDLGGIPGIPLDGGSNPTHARVGFRYPAAFWLEPISAEWNEDGGVDLASVMCDGGREVTADGFGLPGGDPVRCDQAPLIYHGPATIPRNEATAHSTLTLFNNLRLSAMVEWRGSANVMSSDAGCQFSCYPRTGLAVDASGSDAEYAPIVQALAVSRVLGYPGRTAVLNHDASFAKLRELSANYTLPSSLAARVGASRASVTLAGRNLWTMYQADWYTPYDDETGSSIADLENRQVEGFSANMGNPAVPPLSSFMLTLRLSY